MPTRNPSKSRKQALRSLAYRLRGKDPVAYRKGQLFQGEPKPIRRWMRRKMRTIPIRMKMRINEWTGNPTPWMWNPTPARTPKMVRAVRKNIQREALNELAEDYFLRQKKLHYAQLFRRYATLQMKLTKMPRAYQKKTIDKLPPKWRRIFAEANNVGERMDAASNDFINQYLRHQSRIVVDRALEWALIQLGYSLAKRTTFDGLKRVIAAANEMPIPDNLLIEQLTAKMNSERKARELLVLFRQTKNTIEKDLNYPGKELLDLLSGK